MAEEVASLRHANADMAEKVRLNGVSLEEANSDIAATREEASSAALHLSEEVTELRSIYEAAEVRDVAFVGSLAAEQLTTREMMC